MDEMRDIDTALPATTPRTTPMHSLWQPWELPSFSIQCICGSTSVEEYIGDWVDCWTCGACFHAICVAHWSAPAHGRFECEACSGQTPPPRPTDPPDMGKFLYMCCKTNAARAFGQAMALLSFRSKMYFLKYTQDDLCNGVVVAAMVGAKAVLDLVATLFTKGGIVRAHSMNMWNQTPLHLAILHGHADCIPVLAAFQPAWLKAVDVYGSLPMEYMLVTLPHDVMPLLAVMPEFLSVENPITGHSFAHSLCAILPPNFASLVALHPPLLSAPSRWGQTPAMVLMQTATVTRDHFRVLAQLPASSGATTPATDWWLQVDCFGQTVLHLALKNNHVWVLEFAELSRFRHLNLLHWAAELGVDSAVAPLVFAGCSPLQPFVSPAAPATAASNADARTGVWPIMLAKTPSVALELLRVGTLDQLQYLFEHSNSSENDPIVLRIINFMVGHLPLFNFLQAAALASPDKYLTDQCMFLQRFRKCLRLDLKFDQLRRREASSQLDGKPEWTVVPIPAEDDLWACMQDKHIEGEVEWRHTIAAHVKASGAVHLSTDGYFWVMLAKQLRQLGEKLFDAPPTALLLLGKLLAHMVLVRHQLPQVVLPPPFLSTPAEYKPIVAAAFRAGMASVLMGALDNWNGFERFVLLHKIELPLSMHQWKTTKALYDPPFHATHPTTQSFWTVVETNLVSLEQLVCRLRCGLPLRFTPAPAVGLVRKAVMGLPPEITPDRLLVDLSLFVRGLRKLNQRHGQ